MKTQKFVAKKVKNGNWKPRATRYNRGRIEDLVVRKECLDIWETLSKDGKLYGRKIC